MTSKDGLIDCVWEFDYYVQTSFLGCSSLAPARCYASVSLKRVRLLGRWANFEKSFTFSLLRTAVENRTTCTSVGQLFKLVYLSVI
jgi:hypothetical protein